MSNNERSPDNPAWRQLIIEDVENEGFDYAFTSYDDYEWVHDAEFLILRAEFLKARKKLIDYVGITDE